MQIQLVFGIILLFGSWQMNLSRSIFESGPPSYKRSTCRIEPQGDGLKVVYDMVGVRGGVIHLEWSGKLDGNDYPVQGMDEVITNAYTKVDDRTFDIIVKVDGNKAATARTVIAPDGKSMTTTTMSRNAQGQTVKTVVVYERL